MARRLTPPPGMIEVTQEILDIGARTIDSARALRKVWAKDYDVVLSQKLVRALVLLTLEGAPEKPDTTLVQMPNAGKPILDSASQVQHAIELQRRVAYVSHAAVRLNRDVREGMSDREAMLKERRYFNQHLAAGRSRMQAARQVDETAKAFGALLGWYAVNDSRTTVECKAAHGSNFRIDQPPSIGFPGTIHRYCRCAAGPPHPVRRSVDGAIRRLQRRMKRKDFH